MSTITTKDGTQIYYKDWGSGPSDGARTIEQEDFEGWLKNRLLGGS